MTQKWLNFDRCALSCDALNVCMGSIQWTLRWCGTVPSISARRSKSTKLGLSKLQRSIAQCATIWFEWFLRHWLPLNPYYNLVNWNFLEYAVVINWAKGVATAWVLKFVDLCWHYFRLENSELFGISLLIRGSEKLDTSSQWSELTIILNATRQFAQFFYIEFV